MRDRPEEACTRVGVVREILQALGVAFLYYLGARVGLAFVAQPEGVAALWPPSGLLVGALVVVGERAWRTAVPAVFLSIVAANWTSGHSLPLSLGFALANCGESMSAAWFLLRACGGIPKLDQLRDVLVFVAGAVVGTNAVTALLGAALVHDGSGGSFWGVWRLWWIEDGVGMLVVAPLLWTTTRFDRTHWTRARLAESLALMGVLAGVAAWVFSQGAGAADSVARFPYLCLPVLFLLALRGGPFGAAVGSFVVACGVVWAAAHTSGRLGFVGVSVGARALMAEQLFLGVAAFTALCVAALYAERVRAERELQENRALLEVVAETTTDSIYVKDREGRYLFLNSAAAKPTGKTVEEILGHDDSVLFAPDTALAIRERDRRLLAEGAPSTFEEGFRRLDGTRSVSLATKGALRDDHGNVTGTFGIARDVTAWKETEEALRLALQRLEAHVHTSPLGVVEFDGDFRILRWEGRAESLFGWRAAEVVGKSIGELRWVHEDDEGRVMRLISDMVLGRRASHVHSNRNYRKDGTILLCDWYNSVLLDGEGKLVSVFSQVLDVTDRERAREALREREALYRAVVETQADGFWLADCQGRLLEVNDAYVRRSGYPRDELLAMSVGELEAQENAEEIDDHIKRLVREGSDLFESVHRAKDGTLWPVEVNASYWPVSGGRFFAFFRDLDRRKRSDMLLRARRELADEAVFGISDNVLQHALDVAERMTSSRIGFFHLVDENQADLTLQAWSTSTLNGMCTAEGKGSHYPISRAGVWVDCVHTREPVIHNDYAALPHKKGMPPGHAPVTRELVVPVVRGGKVVALMGVGNKGDDYTADDVGPVQELAAMTLDLVERTRAEEERERLYLEAREASLTKARLLDEVNHRVKNNLISLLGLILLEQRLAHEENSLVFDAPAERLSLQVRALLVAHDLLSRSEWGPLPAALLCETVVRKGLGGAGHWLSLEVSVAPSTVVVSPRQANSVVLIVNELVTNSRKHGPAPGSAARIVVTVGQEGGFCRLDYRDNGPGYPEEVLGGERLGVGLQLARALAEGTLRGSLALANEAGAAATVRFKSEEPDRT